LLAEGREASATASCQLVRDQWGEEILSGLSSATDDAGLSHGLAVAQRYGAGGARREAAAGFPAAIDIGLPAYRAALMVTGDAELAATQTLFALIAELEDTNLLWRAGPAGLEHARRSAGDFLAAGGVLATGWQQQAAAIDSDFSARRLSPGGQRRPARRDLVSRRTRRIALAMRLALLFSGQGGQRPEHGLQIGADFRQVLADAAIDIAAVDPEKLAKNSIAQPFIFAQQMTLWSWLQADLPRPICAAGYSLGEMAACSAAGAFSAVEGLHLCVERAPADGPGRRGRQRHACRARAG
jgi:hypothetical protein